MIIAALFGGASVGLATSFLNQILHVPFLLAAIIVNGLFHGITQFAMRTPMLSLAGRSNPLEGISTEFLALGSEHTELGMLLLIACGVVGLVGFIFRQQLGYAFAIYGNNPGFFKQFTISTKYVVMSGVVLANACAGLSGFLFAQSNGFADLSMGYGVVLLCITALMLGRLMFRTHRPTVLVPLSGLAAYFLLQQVLLQAGLDLKYFNAFQALFVMAALVLFNRDLAKKTTIDHLGV